MDEKMIFKGSVAIAAIPIISIFIYAVFDVRLWVSIEGVATARGFAIFMIHILMLGGGMSGVLLTVDSVIKK